VSTGFRVACVQADLTIGDVQRNRAHLSDWIGRAVDGGARLVILPEAANAGYMFHDRTEARCHAEPIPDGETVTQWIELAARYGIWIVGGLTESEGDHVFNSSVLLGPEGYIGTFRKAHLWNEEKGTYDHDNRGFPVFETALGRIGLAICYDAWFPESFRSLALGGADLVAVPANWVPVPNQPGDSLTMANMMCMTAAHSNQMYVAAASRIGVERGQSFIGTSMIAGPSGWLLGGPASGVDEELVFADVDLIGSRQARLGNSFNQPLHDRRPEIYRVNTVE